MMLDESKMKLLELLIEPMTVTEIARRMNLSKATVSYHLKILQEMGLVKVAATEIERNFIRKYYISSLITEDPLFPQEKEILDDFKMSKEDFLRTLLRLLNVMNLENSVFLKKIGFDVGHFILAERIEEDDVYEGLAEIWERLRLGRVVESSVKSFIVEECYNCSGLPEIGKPYCRIDEGIIEGILHRKGERRKVREVKCWGTGDEVCEFEIK